MTNSHFSRNTVIWYNALRKLEWRKRIFNYVEGQIIYTRLHLKMTWLILAQTILKYPN
jgi:hypothetical protein